MSSLAHSSDSVETMRSQMPFPTGCGHWVSKFGQKDVLDNAVPSVTSPASPDESLGITQHPPTHVGDLQNHPPVPVPYLPTGPSSF